MSTFTNFGLDAKILQALKDIGFENPTPIQELTIPKVLEGLDIIACAHTGTGKTAAFMLPILHLLSQPEYRNTGKGPQVLVLVPTRELAMQVAEETKKFSKYLAKTKTVCIYGGVPYPLQRKALASKYEILVATPGRLMDHMNQGRIDLSQIKLWVLDEADRMLDMGFVDDVDHIAREIPPSRQTLLFSATIDRKILPVSQRLQKNAHEVRASGPSMTTNNIVQRLYYVDDVRHKMQLLEHILNDPEMNQSIVFTSTKRQADELADYLTDKGHNSEALHGDMNQRQRTRTINKMRTGQIKLLIATDVASRGIDIASLSLVINFDLPFQSEDFIHRIGRTGRAGASGTAITFTTYKEEPKIAKINKLIGKSIEVHTIAGMEPKFKESGKSKNTRRPPFKSRFNSQTSRNSDSNDSRPPRFKREDTHSRFNDSDSKPRFNDDGSKPRFKDFDSKPRFKDDGSKPRFNNFDSKPRFKDDGSKPRFNNFDSKPRFKDDGSKPRFNNFDSKPRFKDDGTKPRFNNFDSKPRFKDDGSKPRFKDFDSKPRFKDDGSKPRFKDFDSKPRFKGPKESGMQSNKTGFGSFAKNGHSGSRLNTFK